jgi:hypothetical protein
MMRGVGIVWCWVQQARDAVAWAAAKGIAHLAYSASWNCGTLLSDDDACGAGFLVLPDVGTSSACSTSSTHDDTCTTT